jgi:glutamate N-acetyltransferase/amino-acid N-acetyltransferase
LATALHSGDPNWGRIVQAIGGELGGRPGFEAPLAVDLTLEGIHVCSAGSAISYDEDELAAALQAKEVEYEIALPGDGAETEVFFSDLSHEYVTFNADYTT